MTSLNRRSAPRRLLLALAFVGAAHVGTRTAHAESPSRDKAAAEALFDEARALMKEGKYEPACPKLVESQRLDAGVGTLLYLASCYEKTGKLATAWATFREAAAAAHRAGQSDREKTATARANALAPVLPRLTIEPNTSQGEPEVTRDGVPVAKALWGTPLPVDPGTHVVAVRLAGYKPRSITLEIPKGKSVNLPIPLLEPAPPSTSPAPSVALPSTPGTSPPTPTTTEPAPPSKPSTLRRALPYAAAGVGVTGVVVGTIFGLRAFSLASDVDGACPSGPCNADVVGQADDSRSAGNVATVAFAVGAVGLAAATVLFLTASPRARAASSPTTFTF